MRFALVCVALAACYQPSAHEGALCGPGDTCPTGQECRSGTCYFTTTPSDANARDSDGVDSSEVTVDAPPDAATVLPWSAPVELASLETPADGEDNPTISNDRKTVILDATPSGSTTEDLFECTRTALTDSFVCASIVALNSPTATDFSPELSPDGNTLYFASDRVSAGSGDVYVSTKTNGIWSTPIMDPDLSVGDVDDIAISPDGLTAISDRGTFYVFSRANTSAAWGTGVAHAEFSSGVSSIAAPSLTNGAAIVYLHAGSPRDIYVTRRLGNGSFKPPTPVTEVNTSATRDAAPFVLQADDYMIFEREYNIYEATR